MAIGDGLHAAPDSAMLNFYLGNLLFEQRDYRGAAVAYRRSLQSTPDFAQGNVNLGRTLLKLHEAQDAADALTRAIELDSDLAEAHFHLVQHPGNSVTCLDRGMSPGW